MNEEGANLLSMQSCNTLHERSLMFGAFLCSGLQILGFLQPIFFLLLFSSSLCTGIR